jgi:hypothetical protein
MAQKDTNSSKSADKAENSKYQYKYRKEYESDWDLHRNYINSFDAYESMLLSQVFDSVSGSVDGSKITDSYAMTLAKERADRVIAKTPDGETKSAGQADVGKAAFMDILRQKWIYPNANAQRPFQEKLNLWQLYSSVYGYMPMFYDWNVSQTGYIGPDCWLWSPRNLVPQQGRVSIEDMDYVTALTWVGKKQLQDILDDQTEPDDKDENKTEMGGWNKDALQILIDMADDVKTDPDADKDSFVTRNRTPQAANRGVCLATRYEAGEDGEWVTFAPDNSYLEIRRIKNPHKNGRIPFVIKYSQPLFDSFYGLGDFQRAKPLQFARDGIRNFYFQAVKMNLVPPIVANANGVVKHTLDYRAGGVMLETIPNSIRRLETSTAGLATYQAVQSDLTGSLLSLYGTQNASIPGADALNPSQGKTPQAINNYSEKEATRDGAERRHLETAIEQLTDGFFSLVVNIGTEDIPIELFQDDIEDIVKAGMEDVLGMFDGNFQPDETMSAGTLTVNPDKLKGVEYRFSIAPDSTMKLSKENQLQQLERIMNNIAKFQNQFKDDPRIEVNWGAIMKQYDELMDIKGAEDFVTVKDGPSPQELQQQQEQAKMQQEQQMQAQQQAHDAQMQQMQADQNAQPPAPAVGGGMVFNDKHVASAADIIKNL